MKGYSKITFFFGRDCEVIEHITQDREEHDYYMECLNDHDIIDIEIF